MAETKRTDGAVRAAKHINKRQYIVFNRDTWSNDELAGLIDRETGLPELRSRIDRLEAEKAELVEAYRIVESMLTTYQRKNLVKYEDNKEYKSIKAARAALAKAEPVNMTSKTSTLAEQIMATFSYPNDWRTVGGIARALDISESEVCSFLDSHPELFECSPTKFMGQTFYRVRGKR